MIHTYRPVGSDLKETPSWVCSYNNAAKKVATLDRVTVAKADTKASIAAFYSLILPDNIGAMDGSLTKSFTDFHDAPEGESNRKPLETHFIVKEIKTDAVQPDALFALPGGFTETAVPTTGVGSGGRQWKETGK